MFHGKAFLFFHNGNGSAFPESHCVSEFPTLLLLLLLLLLWMTVTWNLNSVLCPPRSFSRDQRTEEDIRHSSVVPCYAPSLLNDSCYVIRQEGGDASLHDGSFIRHDILRGCRDSFTMSIFWA
ncbi:hypothetical protein HOY80DRAFT_1051165 [Tuber brumale]|nr:hypothetical protein HOY80DRAFT_1051165 [Tuber brumale]